MTAFSASAVANHIRRNHPGCPPFAVDFFAREVASKRWKNASIGMAVGITLQNFMRHHMTHYDQLLLEGMDRDQARRLVKPKIDAMLAAWQKKPNSPPSDRSVGDGGAAQSR